jgi:hypothetical protein
MNVLVLTGEIASQGIGDVPMIALSFLHALPTLQSGFAPRKQGSDRSPRQSTSKWQLQFIFTQFVLTWSSIL